MGLPRPRDSQERSTHGSLHGRRSGRRGGRLEKNQRHGWHGDGPRHESSFEERQRAIWRDTEEDAVEPHVLRTWLASQQVHMHGARIIQQMRSQADLSRLVEMVVGDKGDDGAPTGDTAHARDGLGGGGGGAGVAVGPKGDRARATVAARSPFGVHERLWRGMKPPPTHLAEQWNEASKYVGRLWGPADGSRTMGRINELQSSRSSRR